MPLVYGGRVVDANSKRCLSVTVDGVTVVVTDYRLTTAPEAPLENTEHSALVQS